MRRYLLDSNAVNAVANSHQPLLGRAQAAKRRGDRLGTCEPVVAELYYGLELSSSPVRSRALIEDALRSLNCWPLDREAAKEYGRIAGYLRHTGRTIQTIDVMIAAIALTLGNCTVATTDSDFAAIPGLDVIDWTLPPPTEQTQP